MPRYTGSGRAPVEARRPIWSGIRGRAWRSGALFVGALGVLALVLTVFPADLGAQALSSDVVKAFKFRAIGPSRQSGRFVDFAVPEKEPHTIYAATGSGGLWKSVNNGISWDPIFDTQPVISIGDIAVAVSNPAIVWVGTGEHTSSRSTYWGDGVYKSIDGGKTWTNMGLTDSHHIGRIIIDPKLPDTVYVAALGHLYSENAERGVFKTIDGGKTWTKSLDVKIGDRAIGASELVMDPVNPKILYAATYDKERKPWTFNLAGPGGGIYKTIDAGKTWTKLGGGLPAGMPGRIGLGLRRPNISTNIRTAKARCRMPTGWPNCAQQASAGMIGEVYTRKTWKKVSRTSKRLAAGGYYYMQIASIERAAMCRADSGRDARQRWRTAVLAFRFGGINHAMWIGPANSNHMLLGHDRHGHRMTAARTGTPRTAAGAVRGGLRHHVAYNVAADCRTTDRCADPAPSAAAAGSCSRTGRRWAAATACTT